MTTIYVKATTRAQREALLRLFQRDFPGWWPRSRPNTNGLGRTLIPSAQWRRFRKRFRWQIGGYIGGEWKGMFVGIERDGYTHT